MTERLLAERDVLNKLGWLCRGWIDHNMRRHGFPKPYVRPNNVIGDQWRESEVERWLGLGEGPATGGTEALIARLRERAEDAIIERTRQRVSSAGRAG